MAFKKTLVIKKEEGVALDVVPLELTLNEATALYVKAELSKSDKFTYNPAVQIFRLVDVSDGCCSEEECIPFGETCSVMYVPRGHYSITACSLDSNKYYDEVTDAEIKIHIIGESLNAEHKDVLMMNANKGC